MPIGTSALPRRIGRTVRDLTDPVARAACAPRPLADPAPWSPDQRRALTRAVTRECGWGLRQVHREVAVWRARADRIPHPEVRANALETLSRKRSYLDGAALFWTLPEQRDPRLLSLLVRFQIAADFLDQASERGVAARGRSGGSLMSAFVDAVDLGAPPAGAYYADHPWADDGGYLDDLVAASRAGCGVLPGYGGTRELLVREARHARALELVHEPDPRRRDGQLRGLARELEADEPARGGDRWPASDPAGRGAEAPVAQEASLDDERTAPDPWWFENAAGSASALTVIVLLALAADPAAGDEDRRAAARAYRWVGALSTMLDGYVDQAEDAASGEWNAVARYADASVATERIGSLIDRALREVGQLRHGERHVVIVSAMVALFLSRDSARSGELAASTNELIDAGGTLTRRLVPALRAWRAAYGQRGA